MTDTSIPRVTIGQILDGDHTDKEVKVRGWIYRTRSSGKICFITLRDSTGILQLIVSKRDIPEEEFAQAKKALVESSVILTGNVREEPRAPTGYEMHVTGFNVVHFAGDFPISKDQSDEHLLDNRHLWIRSREMNASLRVRGKVFEAFHTFMIEAGFTETHSPSFVASACEGGATLFPVDYYGKDKVYLTQSWQLYAESIMFSLERIYTVAPSYRAEKSRTRRHLTEFWHAEVEEAWVHNEDMMEMEERLLVYIIKRVLEDCPRELEVLGRDTTKLAAIQTPFERYRYEEVLDMLREKGIDLEFGADFGYEEEKVLTAERTTPMFITHFPKEKGFYHRRDPEDGRVLLCHDLLAPEGYGEIIGGGERESEPELLERNISQEGLEPEDYGFYNDIRKYGAVPHSGFGLGLDRTITWICGLDHIMKVIPFPRTMRRITP